jgi:hypothetical protein
MEGKLMVRQKVITGYKFITTDMKSKNGNTVWKLKQWQIHQGELELCAKGFHACRTAYQATNYVYGDKLFLVEARGNILETENDKFVASEMRLVKELPTKQIFVEYALKCAWRNLKHFEKAFPKDKRCRNALLTVKRYLAHPTEANRSAAESAARSAAWSAPLSAAWSAESAAEYAALSAERSAAESAASAARSAASAARSAAWSAESAAWSAASAAESAAFAALSAAWSAESAAWSAASAARSAARSAAEYAEKEWQAKTFNTIVQQKQDKEK